MNNQLLPQALKSQAELVAAGETLKTFRLAMAASGEYTQFHGGTVALGLAAIVTVVNRVNQVYEVDLSVSLQLVGNNDEIVYTDITTDPYDNSGNDIDTNQSVLDNIIGSQNYDVGHVVNTGAGGLAALGSVCTSFKAQGITGTNQPTGDPFMIDYVAHELGHQFAGQHSFNGSVASCANRSSNDAYEPGSGATIMAYAGICGEQNLQNNSDAMFHAHSVAQMRSFIANTSCGTSSDLNNSAPVVQAGNDVTIPISTAFKLTGSATDSDNDNLLYAWEQLDLGAPSTSAQTMVDDGSRPLFRSWLPVSEPTRYFPRLSNVLSQTTVIGETYPTTTRVLNFRLSANFSWRCSSTSLF
jgi:hypothetical protein